MADSNNNQVIWQDRKHHLWFPWSFTKYYIENGRLMIQTGLLSSTLDETLLYRIVDITMKQTLAGKIFGTGSLIVKTKVDSNPEIILENIAKPKETWSMLSNLVEESRRNYNVVGKEFYGSGHHDMDDDIDFDGTEN